MGKGKGAKNKTSKGKGTVATVVVKQGMAKMLKGGVIMDVVTPEQARIVFTCVETALQCFCSGQLGAAETAMTHTLAAGRAPPRPGGRADHAIEAGRYTAQARASDAHIEMKHKLRRAPSPRAPSPVRTRNAHAHSRRPRPLAPSPSWLWSASRPTSVPMEASRACPTRR